MATIGYATLQIIPSLQGVSETVNRQLSGLSTLGKTAGKQLGDALAAGVESASKRVETAAEKTVKARDKEADAAGKLETAEAKLQALRAKGVTDAGRLTDAEQKVEKAKRDQASASRDVTKYAKEEERATGQLTEAKKRADHASNNAASSGGRLSGWLGGFRKQTEDASKSTDGLTGKVKGLGSTLSSNLGFGATLGVGAIVGGLVKMGDEFANVNKTIAYTTGASGAALESMNQSVRKIGKSAPFAMTDIATSIADVAKATQLTGQPLEDMTQRVMKLGRMGQNVDIGTLTQSMRAFGVPAREMPAQLDNMYRAAISSGMGVQELSEMALKGAPQFKQFGLTLNDTAAMMGSLHKAGIRGEQVTIGMNKAMIALSKGGGDVKVKLGEAVTSMQDMIKSGNMSGATTMAGKLFGTKSAGQFIEAIKQGKFNIDEMVGSLDKQKNGIMDAGGAVPTMAGAWQLLKNNVMVELEPIVTRLFSAMSNGIMWIREHGSGIIHSFGDKFKALANFFKDNELALSALKGILSGIAAGYLAIKVQMVATMVVGKIGSMVTAMKAWRAATAGQTVAQRLLNITMMMNPIGLIVGLIVGLGVALWAFFTKTETGRKLWASIWGGIKAAVSAVSNWFTQTAWPAIKGFFTGIWNVVKNVVGWIKDHWKLLLGIITGPIGMAVMLVITHFKTIKDVVVTVKNWIVDRFNDVVGFVTSLPGKIKNAASGMWDGIKDAFKSVINWVIRAWNRLEFRIPEVKLFGKTMGGFTLSVPKIREFATGGYTGNLPVNQIAGVVHGDEHVTRASSRRRIERDHPGLMDYINAHGMLPTGYKDGGRVDGYGLDTGTNTGGYGNPSARSMFPEWLNKLGDDNQVKPSTYPGHQESDRGEAGYEPNPQHKNRGVDWSGSVDALQAFASKMLSLASRDRAIEQVIWQNPTTGQKLGWAGRKDVSSSGYYSSDYAGHKGHVHTRFNSAIGGGIAETVNDSQPSTDTSPTSDSGKWDYSSGSAAEKKSKYEADTRKAKSDYDAELSKLKDQYGVGASNSELSDRGSDIAKRKRDLAAQYRNDREAAKGNKDKLASLRDEYSKNLNALRDESDRLADDRDTARDKKGGDKEAYKAAKEALDKKFDEEKQARKEAFEKAKSDSNGGGDKSYPTTISGWAQLAASEFVGGQMSSMLGVLGISDNIPALDALSQAKSQIRVTDKSGKHLFGDFAAPSGPNAPTNDGKDSKPNSATMATNTPEGNIAAGDAGAKEAVWAEWAKHGWQTAGQWMDTLRLVNGESSWKVGASYSGPAKSDARGLFQFLSSTAAQYGYGDTAADQAVGGAKYIAARYKNPSAAWSFWQNPSDKSVSGGHWYEQGGWLQPGTDQRVHNGTGRPEAVLNAKQWVDMKDTADFVRNTRSRVPQQSAPQVTYNMHARDTEDLFIQAQRQERVRAAAKVSRW